MNAEEKHMPIAMVNTSISHCEPALCCHRAFECHILTLRLLRHAWLAVSLSLSRLAPAQRGERSRMAERDEAAATASASASATPQAQHKVRTRSDHDRGEVQHQHTSSRRREKEGTQMFSSLQRFLGMYVLYST
jgi:hypothetical protein